MPISLFGRIACRPSTRPNNRTNSRPIGSLSPVPSLKKVNCCQHIIDLTNTVIVLPHTPCPEVESQTYQAPLIQSLLQCPYHVVGIFPPNIGCGWQSTTASGWILTGSGVSDPFTVRVPRNGYVLSELISFPVGSRFPVPCAFQAVTAE
jgi:hypothetical protein